MNKFLKSMMLLALPAIISCSKHESLTSSTKATVVNHPGACTADPGFSGFSSLHIACRNPNMTPNLMNYCMSNYKTKFEALTPQCKTDFEGLASLRKGVTTVITNAMKVQLGLNDLAKKDILDAAGLDQTMGYLHSWLKTFSEAFYAKNQTGEYVPSIEGAFSQLNFLIDQKIQAIELKDKSKVREETSLKYELMVLESALKSYTPDNGSDLLIAARLRSTIAAVAPKIDTLIRVHDMACSISDCANSASDSNLIPFVQLLGSFGLANFQSLASAANAGLSADSEYSRFAKAMEKYSALISNVIVQARIASINPNPGVYFPELQRTVDGYRSMSVRFSKDGFFRDTESNVLAYGFSEEARDSVKGLLGTLKGSLVTDKQQYDAAVDRLFGDLQNLNSTDAELEKTRISVDGIARDMASINLDILGLTEANRSDEASLARYAEQMKRILEGNKVLKNSFDSIQAFDAPRTIKASDSTFSLKDLDGSREITKLAVAKVSLRKGQILNLGATGEWSPICALKETYASTAQFRYDSIKTGPDGYSSIQSLNSSVTNSREQFDSFVVSDSNGSSMQNCLNSSLTFGLGGSGSGFGFGPTGNQCNNSGKSIEVSHGYRDAKTSSDSIMDSASFQGGLTLKKTPFAQYPAGSLLAFVSPVGGENLISQRLDVKVIGRQTMIHASEDMTVSLVINDCQEGNVDIATGLTVQGEILTPRTAGAKSLMESILTRLPEFKKSAEDLLKQGVAIEDQLSVKKGELLSQLAESDADFYKISEIQGVVNFWIDNEILKVKRMAQINAKGREMARLADEATRQGIQSDYLRSNVAVYRMRLNESISRLRLAPLESTIGTVSDVIIKRVLPVLKFYALANVPEVGVALKKNLAIEMDPYNLSLAIDNFLKDLSNSIAAKESDLGSVRQTGRFVVRFPKPDASPSTLPVRSFPTVDRARSVAIWRALLGQDKAGFFAAEPAVNLDLKDVYSKTNLFGINCKTSNVVIDDMALIFLVNSNVNAGDIENLNQLPGILMQAGPDFDFAQTSGQKTYVLRNPNEGNYGVKVGFLAEDKATSFGDVFNRVQFDQSTAKGLSPFASFRFDAAPLKTVLQENYESLGFPAVSVQPEPEDDYGLDIFGNGAGGGSSFDSASLPSNVTDILLAFKVRGVKKNGDLSWIETCK